MDFFQGVVSEYLRANRATFVNPEFYITLKENDNKPQKGTSWYVDLLAVNFADKTVYLCEVTYSSELSALISRLAKWSDQWQAILRSIRRDAAVPESWEVRPWIFVPEALLPKLIRRLPDLPVCPRITTLEMTAPWCFRTWDRQGEAEKPSIIPEKMRS